jgi:hypothetical protein
LLRLEQACLRRIVHFGGRRSSTGDTLGGSQMDKMTRRAFGAGGFVLLLATSATFAQQQSPTVRVRGTIERIDGSTYVVKTRDGAELRVALADNPQIAGVVKASLSDIKQGSFVGVTAMPPDRTGSTHLSGVNARNRRRTLSMGPSAPEHDDQRER